MSWILVASYNFPQFNKTIPCAKLAWKWETATSITTKYPFNAACSSIAIVKWNPSRPGPRNSTWKWDPVVESSLSKPVIPSLSTRPSAHSSSKLEVTKQSAHQCWMHPHRKRWIIADQPSVIYRKEHQQLHTVDITRILSREFICKSV